MDIQRDNVEKSSNEITSIVEIVQLKKSWVTQPWLNDDGGAWFNCNVQQNQKLSNILAGLECQ